MSLGRDLSDITAPVITHEEAYLEGRKQSLQPSTNNHFSCARSGPSPIEPTKDEPEPQQTEQKARPNRLSRSCRPCVIAIYGGNGSVVVSAAFLFAIKPWAPYRPFTIRYS